jgi:hypothetical protein
MEDYTTALRLSRTDEPALFHGRALVAAAQKNLQLAREDYLHAVGLDPRKYRPQFRFLPRALQVSLKDEGFKPDTERPDAAPSPGLVNRGGLGRRQSAPRQAVTVPRSAGLFQRTAGSGFPCKR